MNQKIIIISLLLVLSPAAIAGKTFFGFGGGRSHLTHVEDEVIPETTERDSYYQSSLNAEVGYQFSPNIIAAINYKAYQGDSIGNRHNRIHVTEYGALLGYKIELLPKLHVIPAVVYSNWRARSKEGDAKNPGGEKKKTFKGDDFLGRLMLELPVNEVFALNVSYSFGKYDFAEIKAHEFGFKFYFQ